MTKILVATGNKGKLAEYRDLLQELNLEWLSLKDVGLANMEVDETGDTFEENARIKAQAYGDAAGLLTIADDSGLEIEVLGGAPGIYSARYGAPEVTTDVGRYQKVLREMEGVTERSARFVCVVAIFEPGHGVKLARGDWHGQIGEGPRGANRPALRPYGPAARVQFRCAYW